MQQSKDMDESAKIKKCVLEFDIMILVNKFEQETKCDVKEIHIERNQGGLNGAIEKHTSVNVKIEL